MTSLTPADFSPFFKAVHGVPPFPWQTRLLEQIVARGTWPDLLDLPTGSGKTAAMDVAVFHLALEAAAGTARRAAVRIAFVVDRRLVVDDAFLRAERLAEHLADPKAPDIIRRVADRLRVLAGDDAPLLARRLRGGLPREDDWAATPCQPTILCSTIDQVGSRLLFRGYGVAPAMAPVQAGLLGSDCLLLLDEAHLAEPFRQTVQAISRLSCLRGPDPAPPRVTLLSATVADAAGDRFALSAEDRAHPVLAARLGAAKPAELKRIKDHRAPFLADEAIGAVDALRARGIAAPAVAVVVNRVARARAVFDAIRRTEIASSWEICLVIGTARGADRDAINAQLTPVKTGAPRTATRPMIIVATQTIEAGVDLDLDGLVTEVAALDALRQRFGRLNRGGRAITPYAAILAADADLKPGDPVYGDAPGETWQALGGVGATVDFGINAFEGWLRERGLAGEAMARLLAPTPHAPILMPAHVDLWSQTSPVPACDPEPALFLHGPDRAPDSVRVLWRADIDDARLDDDRARADLTELLALVPPRAAEVIELPVWAVRDWLAGRTPDLADIAMAEPPEVPTSRRHAFRWAGPDSPRTGWVLGHQIAPGDTIVVPSSRGGCDRFGWNPGHEAWTDDVYDRASEPFAGRRIVLRMAEGLLIQEERQSLGSRDHDLRDEEEDEARRRAMTRLRHVRDLLDGLGNSPTAREVLDAAFPDEPEGFAKVRWTRPAFPYDDADGRRLRVVLVGRPADEKIAATSEDDDSASFLGHARTLTDHSARVRDRARDFAHRAGLPETVADDVALAGWLHDAGKADPRFQRFLAGGDPFAVDDRSVLAKSADGRSPRGTWERVGLPPRWRHEALSVRLALVNPKLGEAHDRALVLWLIGTHHGHGRPFFPDADPLDQTARRLPAVTDLVPAELPPGDGPRALGFDIDGLDWASLFAALRDRYGTWGLARLEAVLRLADHRASEQAETGDAPG